MKKIDVIRLQARANELETNLMLRRMQDRFIGARNIRGLLLIKPTIHGSDQRLKQMEQGTFEKGAIEQATRVLRF